MRQTIFLLCAALACLSSAIQAQPERTEREALRSVRLLEVALAAEGSADAAGKAAAAYRDLRRRFPGSANVGNACADYASRVGDVGRALQIWRETLTAHPANAEAAFQLGHATLQHGETADALDYLRQAASSPEATPFQIHSYATALFLFRHEARGRTSDAALAESLAQFRRAAELETANLEYARGYAETFFALPLPDWKLAQVAWSRVVELTPAADPALGFHLLQAARASLRAGQPAAALGFLDRLPGNRPGKVAARLRAEAERSLDRPPPNNSL